MDDRVLAAAMRCISAWSVVDSSRSNLLRALLRSDFEVTASVFNRVNSGRSRQEMLLDACAVRFGSRSFEFRVTRELLKRAYDAETKRNSLAHCLVFPAPAPTAMLLVTVADIERMAARANTLGPVPTDPAAAKDYFAECRRYERKPKHEPRAWTTDMLEELLTEFEAIDYLLIGWAEALREPDRERVAAVRAFVGATFGITERKRRPRTP